MSTGLDAARDAILARSSFLLTSHARPDGDSIGSQLAMAFALDALGKTVRIVNADPAPSAYADFPGVERIEVAPSVEGTYDALIVMECGTLDRAGFGWDTVHQKVVSPLGRSPRIFPIPLYNPDEYDKGKETGRNATLPALARPASLNAAVDVDAGPSDRLLGN